MPEFKKVAKISELVEGAVKGVKVGNNEVALYLEGGKVFATSDRCTHEDCVISENHQMEGKEVECTCHGSRFNIETGAVTQAPAVEALPVFKVKVENGEVFVEV